MFRMVRDGRLELDAQVPETELALIRAGQTATISSDQLGQTTGRVRIVTPEVNADNRLGVARIALAGAGGFRPGMFAKTQIDVGAQPTITVPTAAVLYRENRSGVFVLMTNGHVRFQPVNVLSRAEDRTSVTGLNAGAQVVVEGAGFLGDGDRVNVVPARAPAAAAAPATTPAAPAAR
jgi:RND family efflux transporter MFP subunit